VKFAFDERNFTNVVLAETKAQKATTFEVGTRDAGPTIPGSALYRMQLRGST
jgi:hypothetical protein